MARHRTAPISSSTNYPPARIDADGAVPVIPKIEYGYNLHLPPALRVDQHGNPNALPKCGSADFAVGPFSGTVGLPFPKGTHGCVAVKVINPRGNEVTAVERLR